MTQTRPVLAIGECLIDLIAVDGQGLTDATTLAIREGGAPMNVAVGLARMGTPSAFCGVVGNDPFGQRLRQTLAANGVDISHLHTSDRDETSVAYAWRDVRGDGHFRLLRQADCRLSATFTTGAVKALHPSAIVIGSVSTATSTSKLGVMAAIRSAKASGSPIVVDLNIRISQWKSVERLRLVLPGLLRQATLIKLSVDDAREAWGLTDPDAIRRQISEWNDARMVITDGSRGAVVFQAESDDAIRYPVFPVEAVEPTGAGDAFLAGLITRQIDSGWSPITVDDIRFAMAAGAIATTKPGALTALPTRNEIEAFLTTHP
jgi:fructokinase